MSYEVPGSQEISVEDAREALRRAREWPNVFEGELERVVGSGSLDMGSLDHALMTGYDRGKAPADELKTVLSYMENNDVYGRDDFSRVRSLIKELDGLSADVRHEWKKKLEEGGGTNPKVVLEKVRSVFSKLDLVRV